MAEGGKPSQTVWYFDNSKDGASASSPSSCEDGTDTQTWEELFKSDLDFNREEQPGEHYQKPRTAPEKVYQVPSNIPLPEEASILGNVKGKKSSANFEKLARLSGLAEVSPHSSPETASSQGYYEDIEWEPTQEKPKKKIFSRSQRSSCSFIPKQLKKPAQGLAQLGNKLANMRDLSESFKSLLHLKDDSPERSQEVKHPAPVHLLRPSQHPDQRSIYTVFVEGPMGVGKSTLITSMAKFSTGDNVICFLEPLNYWKHVFSDCIQQVYKYTSPWRAGRKSTSCRLLSIQTKFRTPIECLQTAIDRCMAGCEPQRQKGNENWVLVDRHLISPCVVFPLLFLKRGLLSFDHFLSLISGFRASPGDTIALLTLHETENLRRLKERSRVFEETVDAQYLKDLVSAYHSVYCSWLLLQYVSCVGVVEVCMGSTNIVSAYARTSSHKNKCHVVEKLFSKSIFPILADIVEPFSHSPTLMELCYGFCLQLKKLQFLVTEVTEFTDDVPGLWTSIYMQAVRSPSIKTRTGDWKALTALSKDFIN